MKGEVEVFKPQLILMELTSEVLSPIFSQLGIKTWQKCLQKFTFTSLKFLGLKQLVNAVLNSTTHKLSARTTNPLRRRKRRISNKIIDLAYNLRGMKTYPLAKSGIIRRTVTMIPTFFQSPRALPRKKRKIGGNELLL